MPRSLFSGIGNIFAKLYPQLLFEKTTLRLRRDALFFHCCISQAVYLHKNLRQLALQQPYGANLMNEQQPKSLHQGYQGVQAVHIFAVVQDLPESLGQIN